jgi:hypothetical protein
LSYKYNFFRDFSKFPRCSKLLDVILEPEHNHQLRKIILVVQATSMPIFHCKNTMLRLAGIRAYCITAQEASRLIDTVPKEVIKSMSAQLLEALQSL